MAGDPALRSGSRADASGPAARETRASSLHAVGSSVMGFGLTVLRNNQPAGSDRLVRVMAASEPRAELPGAMPVPQRNSGRARAERTVRIRSPKPGDGDLTLTLGTEIATVQASPAAWETLQEPVLLAITQYWRFAVIDRELDRLDDLARRDLPHATSPTFLAYGERRRLLETARAARALILDLPHFQGALTDPYAYASCERSAEMYESLAEKLGLLAWCEHIDERAEGIEAAYDRLVDKLFEYRNFLVQAAVEIVIVLILLGELGVLLWDGLRS